MTRGKFQCSSDTKFADEGSHQYRFYPVSNDETPENARFHKYTPSGEITLFVDNPNVSFVPGEYYYVDFSPCSK